MNTLERVLRYILIGTITLLPFVPFVVAGSLFFPYITGKNFMLRIVVEIAFALWLVLALYRPQYRPTFSWILALFAAFVLSIGISDILGPNPFKSFWSNFERMEGWVTLVHLLMLLVVLTGIMKTKELWQRFLLVSVLASAYLALIGSIITNNDVSILAAIFLYFAGVGIMLVPSEKTALTIFATSFGTVAFLALFCISNWYQYVTNLATSPRISGTFGNPIYLAIYCAFHAFFSMLLLLWYRPQGAVKWMLRSMTVLLPIVMVLTATRGTTLGFFVGMTVAGIVYLLISLSKKLGVTFGSIIALGGVGAVLSIITLLFGSDAYAAAAHVSLRAALVFAAAATALVAITTLYQRSGNWAHTIIASLLLSGVALSGIFVAIKDMPLMQTLPIVSRFATITLDTGTAASRSMIWNMGIQGVAERPLFGWGQENFSFVFDKYFDPNMYAQEPWFDRVHNIVFDWLIQGGLVGALLYFLVPIAICYYLWFYQRSQNHFSAAERSLMSGIVVLYFFHNLFVFDNITSYLFYAVVLALIHTRAIAHSNTTAAVEGKSFVPALSEQTSATIVAPIVAVVCIIVIYYVNIPGLKNAFGLIEGIQYRQSNPERSFKAYESAAARNTLGSLEVTEQIVQIASASMRAPEAAASSLLPKLVALATNELEAELTRAPNMARLTMFNATFLAAQQKFPEALAEINTAEKIAPKKQLVKFQKAEILLNQGKFSEAQATLEEAYALTPAYDDAAILLAFAAIYAGDTIRAREVLVEKFGTEAVDDPRLVRAYRDRQIFAPIIDIFKARSLAAPNDVSLRVAVGELYFKNSQKDIAIQTFIKTIADFPNATEPRVSLAAAYVETNQRPLAIQTLKDAIVAIPSFKESGEKYITEIQQKPLPKK